MAKALPPLVIGVGNLSSGDDAAGRLVAQALTETAHGFDVVESFGTAADLVTTFEGRTQVLLVDACRSGAPVGTIHEFNAVTENLPDYLNAISSHGIGVVEGVELARALGMLPDICEVIAIEGGDFTIGAPLSSPVKIAINACVSDISDRFSQRTLHRPARR